MRLAGREKSQHRGFIVYEEFASLSPPSRCAQRGARRLGVNAAAILH
jgi:hypothetical protein